MIYSQIKSLLWNPLFKHVYFQKNYSKVCHVIDLLTGGSFLLAKIWSWFIPIIKISKLTDNNGETYYLLHEKQPSGLGSFLFRKTGNCILQAPHSFFDLNTGKISLRMFLKNSNFRALWVNSSHRYVQENGVVEKQVPSEKNLADAAHNSNHGISQATDKVFKHKDLCLIQVHGFEMIKSSEDNSEEDPHVIVSSGTEESSEYSEKIFNTLKENLETPYWYEVKHYNNGVYKLGGTTNVQGKILREYNRNFVHLEISDVLREELMENDKILVSLSKIGNEE